MAGSIDDDTTSFITEKKTLDYFKTVNKSSNPKDLAQVFKKCSKESLRILRSMLELNPHHRVSSQDLMEDPYFDSVRVPEIEIGADCLINLPYDQTGTYDHNNDKDLYFKDMDDLKKVLFKEIRKLKR